MELPVVSLDGKKAGSVQLSDAIFGLDPRADLLHRMVNWQLNKRQAGTHDVKNRAEIWRTGKKMYAQKGTGRARHSSARANLFRGGGRSFGPTPRSHATDLTKQMRQLALKHALSSKAKSSDLIVIDEAKLGEAKTKQLAQRFGKLGLNERADHRRRRGREEFRAGGAQSSRGRRTAGRRHQRLRHPAPHQAGADQGRSRRTGGAPQMTAEQRHYDVIIAPLITEKATAASEKNQVVFEVAKSATKPQIKEAIEKLFDVKVKRVNTLNTKRKTRVFRGRRGVVGNFKKAIVTLEEGHSIDVTTGL